MFLLSGASRPYLFCSPCSSLMWVWFASLSGKHVALVFLAFRLSQLPVPSPKRPSAHRSLPSPSSTNIGVSISLRNGDERFAHRVGENIQNGAGVFSVVERRGPVLHQRHNCPCPGPVTVKRSRLSTTTKHTMRQAHTNSLPGTHTTVWVTHTQAQRHHHRTAIGRLIMRQLPWSFDIQPLNAAKHVEMFPRQCLKLAQQITQITIELNKSGRKLWSIQVRQTCVFMLDRIKLT